MFHGSVLSQARRVAECSEVVSGQNGVSKFEKEKSVLVCPSFFSIVRLTIASKQRMGGTVSLKICIAITDSEHAREREIRKSGYALRFW